MVALRQVRPTASGTHSCDELPPQVRRINETIVAALSDDEAAAFDAYPRGCTRRRPRCRQT